MAAVFRRGHASSQSGGVAYEEAGIPVMQSEEAHSDLSRLDAQRGFIDDRNFKLDLPLKWTMYGERFVFKVY